MSTALLLALLLSAAFTGYAPRRAPMPPPHTATALLTVGARDECTASRMPRHRGRRGLNPRRS
jgi:hypothetical protein